MLISLLRRKQEDGEHSRLRVGVPLDIHGTGPKPLRIWSDPNVANSNP